MKRSVWFAVTSVSFLTNILHGKLVANESINATTSKHLIINYLKN